MRYLARTLEALASGLFVALLAPAVAAAAFAIGLEVTSEGFVDQSATSPENFILLAIGFASAAYFLGAIPAFLSGLALPVLRRKLSPAFAAFGTGILGAAAYLASFGAHLFSSPHPVRSVLGSAVPAFIGIAVAAYVFARRHRKA